MRRKTAATVPRETFSSRARSSIGGSWLSGGYSPLAILSRKMRSTLALGSSGSLPGTYRWSHGRSTAYGEYRLDIESIVYNAYSVVDDCVEKMFAFKQRHPAARFELAPAEFAVFIPGQEPVKSLSLCNLMARLERWEQEQVTAE